MDVADGNGIIDTRVRPSHASAFTQLIQLPGSSRMENSLVVFEYEKAESGERRSRDEQLAELQQERRSTLRGDAAESAGEDRPTKPATGSAGA